MTFQYDYEQFMKTKLFPLVTALFMAGCAIVPSSGPSASAVSSIQQTSSESIPEIALIPLTAPVANTLYNNTLKADFTDLSGGAAYADKVNKGDILEITIWEAPPALLFGGGVGSSGVGMAQVTKLPDQMVSSKGTVSVPFVGSITVVGQTPEQIQQYIVARLRNVANQPQVLVRLTQNKSAHVSVIKAGNSMSLPLTSAGERMLDAVAAVGGSGANVQDTSVQLTRGHAVRTIALEDLVANPKQNILLAKGDVVTLITNQHTFTSMGALGKTQEIGFSAKGLSLAEALGRAGGLSDRRADRKGVFVFRYTKVVDLPQEEQQRWYDAGYVAQAEIPTVYQLDLTDAKSLFAMQRFPIRNKDVLYVANAPVAELQKFLSFVFSPIVSGVNSIDNLTTP